MITTRSPFLCNLNVYTPAQRKRKIEFDRTFESTAQGYHELADGIAFLFPADAKSIRALAEWAAMERLCCPFFDFDLNLERERGQFWLRLTGREGAKKFIQADFRLIKDHLIPEK